MRLTSTNFAPKLWTCSLTSGRISNASTTAPRRREVAIACKPATPAPITNTLAGLIVPAAVVNIGKNLGKAADASKTALYPPILAWEDKASITCALLVRGISSMLNAVTFRSAKPLTIVGFPRGLRKLITILPSCNLSTSDSSSTPILRSTSVSRHRASLSEIIFAPACS